MTNKKDREEALSWRDAKDMVWKLRECKDYDDQARMLQSLACNLRAEAVQAERDRCISAVRAERITPENTDNALLCEEDYAYNRALDHAIKAILSDNQEAVKTNDDVDHDLLTIDRCIRYPEHFPGIALEASAALERLALRVKEEDRG